MLKILTWISFLPVTYTFVTFILDVTLTKKRPKTKHQNFNFRARVCRADILIRSQMLALQMYVCQLKNDCEKISQTCIFLQFSICVIN